METAIATKGKRPLEWRCHTPELLKEIADNSNQPILVKPIEIFRSLLEKVAERASQLNDPGLNKLMCRLTLYAIADPQDPDYDEEAVNKILCS